MDVTVIGCGYVGLVTATCLASIGHTVRGVEKDQKKLKTLQDGHCPIFEPGLQELMQENYASGQLQFTDDVRSAVKDAEVVFLCVGTPPKADGTVDMSYLEAAGKEVCDALAENNNDYMVTIIVKSTVPSGTNRKLYNCLKEQTRAHVAVVSNPEFLKEGTAVNDCLNPDRIVIGEVRSEEALDMLQAMNTGHDGSLTTVHANTPRDALTRIETMIAMGATNLPERAMRQQISSAINVVVQQTRLSDGSRRVTTISEITGMEGDIITMQDVFIFEKTGLSPEGKVTGRFRATGVRPKCWERLKAAGINLPPEMFSGSEELR